MSKTILILEPYRFGRNAAEAFQKAGWNVRRFTRGTDDLTTAAMGADVILNAGNMAYSRWAQELPGLTQRVIAAAKASGATVMIPGNVYVYGEGAPAVFGQTTTHSAENALGKLRIEMEEAYRTSGVRTIVLRAGDYIDTCASGNWFDKIIATRAKQGRLSYPGALDRPHAWAFLPDLARAAVALAETRADLPVFADVPFKGYTLTGQQLGDAVARALGNDIRVSTMSWLPIRLARPFWADAKHLIEMRYLWNKPHRIDGSTFEALVHGFSETTLEEAMHQALAGF